MLFSNKEKHFSNITIIMKFGTIEIQTIKEKKKDKEQILASKINSINTDLYLKIVKFYGMKKYSC